MPVEEGDDKGEKEDIEKYEETVGKRDSAGTSSLCWRRSMMRAVWRVKLGGRRGGDEDDCGICDAEAATKAAAVAWLLARSF